MHSEYDDLPASDILGGLALLAEAVLVFVVTAIAIVVAVGAGGFFLNPGKEAQVVAQMVEEVTERACISQAAIYEKLPKPVCAPGTRDVPADALSYPLARTE